MDATEIKRTRAFGDLRTDFRMKAMPRVTNYFVLAFVRTLDGGLLGLEAEEAPSYLAASARARAKVGAEQAGYKIIGALAVSRAGDLASGEIDEAVILVRFGETPDFVDGI